jgi:hypothetical protein
MCDFAFQPTKVSVDKYESNLCVPCADTGARSVKAATAVPESVGKLEVQVCIHPIDKDKSSFRCQWAGLYLSFKVVDIHGLNHHRVSFEREGRISMPCSQLQELLGATLHVAQVHTA